MVTMHQDVNVSDVQRRPGSPLRRMLLVSFGVLVLIPAGLLGACAREKAAAPAPSTAPSSTAATPAASTAAGTPAATATPANLTLLKTSPERGPGGTKFTVTGEGLKPSARLDFVWATVDGSYKTDLVNNEIQYVDRQFVARRAPFGQFSTDAQGRISASFTAPEDFFGAHDIYALLDGKEIAKAGFWIERTVDISPREGPVGTAITVRVTGLGSSAYTSTGSIRYDNAYTGFVSATTTRGTAVFQVRAAGPVGDHEIQFDGASHALPYLNIEQSPVAYIGKWVVPFRVTKDGGPPAATTEWPDAARVNRDAGIPHTTIGAANISSATPPRVSVSSAAGAIRSTPTLEASGLTPGAAIDLLWVTVAGNRVIGGWNLVEEPLAKATASATGTITLPITVPDSLGGWHAVRLASGGKALAEVPYFVERSLESVSPQRVKAGEKFTVQIKGVGWTELDNGVAVMYDNAYMGFACGFASNGDITMEMVATGVPGTHLVDVYPMIYDNAHGKYPWQYNLPDLTFAQDHPSLGLGYRVPVFHLAIEVVP